jgi:hypothetical protein
MVAPRSWVKKKESLNKEKTASENETRAKTYINRADKVFGSNHDVDKNHAKENSGNPSTNKPLHGLLGRQFNELSAAKCDAADVGKNIIGNDEGGRQKEPNHALENIVHDKVSLHNDEVQRHVCPCKVGKLEFVVSSL